MNLHNLEYFYTKIQQGEYDSYSPFIHSIGNILKKSDFSICPLHDDCYSIEDKFGFSLAILIIKKGKQAKPKMTSSLNYIIISEDELKLEIAGAKISTEILKDRKDHQKEIQTFFKEITKGFGLFETNYQAFVKALPIVKDRFSKSLQIKLKNAASRKAFNELSDYFEYSFPAKTIRLHLINWLFCHQIFKCFSSLFKKYSNVLEEDKLYRFFEEKLNFFPTVNATSWELEDMITTFPIEKIENPIKFFSVLVSDIHRTLHIYTVKQSLSSRKTVLLWMKFLQQDFGNGEDNKEVNVLVQNAGQGELIPCLFEHLSKKKNTNYFLFTGHLADYYLSVIKLLGRNTNSINIYLADTLFIVPNQNDKPQQTLFFSNRKQLIQLPQINITIENLTALPIIPTENAISYNKKSKALDKKIVQKYALEKNKKSIGFLSLLRYIRNASDLLQIEGSFFMLVPHHVLYSEVLIRLREALASEFEKLEIIEIFSDEVKGKSLESDVILICRRKIKEKKASAIFYRKFSINALAEYEKHKKEITYDVIKPKNGYWFLQEYQSFIPLVKDKYAQEEGVFYSKFKGLFSKEKKIPNSTLEKYPEQEPRRYILTHPFCNAEVLNVAAYKKEMAALQITASGFLSQPNKYLYTGFHSKTKRFEVLTGYNLPFSLLFSTTQVYPFFLNREEKVDTNNITATAYNHFKKNYIGQLEINFQAFIIEKDFLIVEFINKLKSLTKTLPVLYRYAKKLSDIVEINKNEKLHLYFETFWGVLTNFEIKVNRLLKDAKERKSLLQNVKKAINRLIHQLKKVLSTEKLFEKKVSMISRENIFYYVYAVLHDENFLIKYQYYFRYASKRIPLKKDFYQWVLWGKKLFDLHAGNINGKVNLRLIITEGTLLEKTTNELTIKVLKNMGSIIINECAEISGLPSDVWSYQINGKSPLEWYIFTIKKAINGNLNKHISIKEIISQIEKNAFIGLETQKIRELINTQAEQET